MGTIASNHITVHQYAHLDAQGYADPYGRGDRARDSNAHLTVGRAGEQYPEQQWVVVGCPEPYNSSGFGGCQNGWGEYGPVTEFYGIGTPGDNPAQIVVNGRTIALPHPLMVRSGEPYLAIDGSIFPQMGIDYYAGDKGSYFWFGNHGALTVGLHKKTLGFALLDLAPSPAQIGVFKEGAVYYVQMFPFLNLLGAASQQKNNGTWEIRLPHPDPHNNPWIEGCNRHGYVGAKQLIQCPMDKFVHTPYYTWELTLPGKHPTASLLPGLEANAKLFGLEPNKVTNGDWDRFTKRQIEYTFNRRAADFYRADYSHWRMLGNDTTDAVDAYINAAFALSLTEYGIGWFNWTFNPPRNIALPPQIEDEALSAMGKRDEALDAARRQGLGKGYPLVFPTRQDPGPPGRGTYAVIRPFNPAYATQHRIAGLGEPEVIEGVVSNSGKTAFMVAIERSAGPGSPWLDGVGPIKNVMYVVEVKDGYGTLVINSARGQFQEWFENAGEVNKLLNELERHVSTADRLGWRVRWVFTDVRFGIAMQVRATERFGAAFMRRVEFVYTVSPRPMIPAPPPPGAEPFPSPVGPRSQQQADEPRVFPVPLSEDQLPKEHRDPVPSAPQASGE